MDHHSTQITSTTQLSEEKADMIIKEADINGDGEVSFEEFLKLFFTLEDADLED